MNPARLLEHFDRIAEAPDAIPRLRRFILDLAVRGKLVEQDPNDEPASELLKKIQSEKLRLMREGKIKKLSPVRPVLDSHGLFPVPNTWQWIRLIDVVTKLTDGTHHSPENGLQGDYKYVTAKNIKEKGVSLDNITYITSKIHDEIFLRCNPEPGDILYIKDGATTGIATINDLDEPFSMLSSVALLKPSSHIFNRLLLVFLRSPFFYDQMRDNMKGAAITRVTLKRMEPAKLPLPPLAEQYRIVAKVDELMALCDRLEATQAKRESRRDRLASASLKRISQPEDVGNGEEFRESVRFHLNHLPRLTTRLEHIKELRQAILNLAVRGKLVPQDPNDEPADILLENIMLSKEYLFKQKIFRRQKPLPPMNLGDLFTIPKSWKWIRLGDACVNVSDGPHFSPSYVQKHEGVPFLTAGNISKGYIDLSTLKYVSHADHSEFCKRAKPTYGDVLYSKGGTTGVAVVNTLDFDFSVWVHVAILKILQEFICSHYLTMALNSPHCYVQSQKHTHGTSNRDLGLTRMVLITLPLPPLAEQLRIVAKVNELMALCDQLEAQLTTAQTGRSRLLEATLSEALGMSKMPALRASRTVSTRPTPAPRQTERPLQAAKPRLVEPAHTAPQRSVADQPKPTPDSRPQSNPEAILAQMKPGHDYSRAQLCDALGLSVYEWNMAIGALKENGQVIQTGEKRGARYRLNMAGHSLPGA